jgi:hypothetical protein
MKHTWECPHCGLRQTCIGVIVGHYCPANKSRWVEGRKWVRVEPETLRR